MKTLFVLLVVGLCFELMGQNLLPNHQFESVRPTSESYNPSMQCYNGVCEELTNLFRYTPAQNWTMWLGTYQPYACVMAELVKAASNCVAPWPNFVQNNMMHVKTTVGGSGIVNSDIPAGTQKVKVSCWVYVIKGRVLMSYGPTGSGLVSKASTTTCKWEKIEFIYDGGKGPANQVTLYADKSDAEFYVDHVLVEKL
jgi:hypothetical protein